MLTKEKCYQIGYADGLTRQMTNIGFADLPAENKDAYAEGYAKAVEDKLNKEKENGNSLDS